MSRPAQAIVPEYPHASVTVDQLIAHRNGLAPGCGTSDRHFAPGQPRTTEALLRIVGQNTSVPTFVSGTRFECSNLGYDAAGW